MLYPTELQPHSKNQKLAGNSGGSSNRKTVHLDGWNADADWNGLSIFTAGTHPFVKGEVITYHGHSGEHIRSVADQGCVLDRCGDFAVFDQIRLRSREDELPVGDIHLAAAEVHSEQAPFY